MAIRSLAWSGSGGQDGSETSGVSPNNNPRHDARPPLGLSRHCRSLAQVSETTWRFSLEEDEIVQASRKREGP